MTKRQDKHNNIKNFTETERNNRVCMTCHIIIVIFMELLATLSCVSGVVSLPYYLFTLILGFFSPVAESICWKKNHESTMIKYFVGYGYIAYFTFVIFTSSDGVLFFFSVPLLLVISVYNNPLYSLKVNTCILIESFIITILGGINQSLGFTTLNNAIIQNLVIILFAIFSFWVAKTINFNSQAKINKINEMKSATDKGLKSINHDLTALLESANRTKGAMEQVSHGTNNTAEAVQNQMLQSNSISEKTSLVEDAAGKIDESMKQTLQWVEQGRNDIHTLITKVDETVASSNKTTTLLEELQYNMAEIDKISRLIDSIAFQTNILALNANVEAARAGDAGKGFAVVAGEVSAMSNKTKESNEEIGQMIANISSSLSDVTSEIRQITIDINAQKQSVAKSEASFSLIEQNALFVNENVSALLYTINELASANHGIIDSIQTISAVSEEVSALASEAMNQEFRNTDILNHIAESAQKLTE